MASLSSRSLSLTPTRERLWQDVSAKTAHRVCHLVFRSFSGASQHAYAAGGKNRGGSAYQDPSSPGYGGGVHRFGHGGGGLRGSARRPERVPGGDSKYENHAILQDVRWDVERMPDFQKDLYKEHEAVTQRTPEENKQLVEDLSGKKNFRPFFFVCTAGAGRGCCIKTDQFL